MSRLGKLPDIFIPTANRVTFQVRRFIHIDLRWQIFIWVHGFGLLEIHGCPDADPALSVFICIFNLDRCFWGLEDCLRIREGKTLSWIDVEQ